MELFPEPDTNTFGRSDFFIHGDSKDHPGAASHGCIIVGPDIRKRIDAENTDRLLEVVDGR